MATTMGKDGKPTPIDFSKQFVLAIVLPVTDFATEINPVKVEEKGDSLLYSYEVKTGEKQSYSIQPVSIIILDKKYENKEVVIVNNQETTYFPAIDHYLTEQIGSQYAKGEHSVPFHSIVGVDEHNAEDILVWGDFWVFNYNQVGDTLKCVSGGSHPGLMHICQTDNGYKVSRNIISTFLCIRTMDGLQRNLVNKRFIILKKAELNKFELCFLFMEYVYR